MSTPRIIFEGTGEEVSRFAKGHPAERFRLTVVEGSTTRPFDPKVWDEVIARIESNRGRFPVLSDSAFSTEALYEGFQVHRPGEGS